MDIMYEELKQKYPEKAIGSAEDLSGRKFGSWTVLYRTNNDNSNKSMWVCQCSCDNHTIKPVSSRTLKNGTSNSCGCERLRLISEINDKKIHIRDENGVLLKKRCFRCRYFLPLNSFYRSRCNKDGYSNECKTCDKQSLMGRYNIYKKGAKKRNLDFQLSKSEFETITKQPCYYCGEYSNIDIYHKPYNGIDRIDSSYGYIQNNVVPCCDICNRMKLDYSKELFILHIGKIFNYTKDRQL